MPLNNSYFPSQEHGNHSRRFKGSFAPNGASGISAAAGAVRGTGFVVSRTAVGKFKLQLEVPFKQLLSGQATYQGLSADSTATTVNIGDVNGAATGGGTVELLVYQAGSLADITASAVARRINFSLDVAVNDNLGSGATA